MRYRTFSILMTVLVGVGGCVENGAPSGPRPKPPPLSTEPIGLQIRRAEPTLTANPFRVLLDFERATDLSFVMGQGAEPQLSGETAHTGKASLKLERGGKFAVKLSSLVSGGVPGNWTIAGGYFCAPAGAKVHVALVSPAAPGTLLERVVEIRPGQAWVGVLLDLTELRGNVALDPALLSFSVEGGGAVYLDDVLVVNNSKTLETPAEGDASGWTIKQGGFAIVIEKPERFRVSLKTPEVVEDGWSVVETSDLRARFKSVSGTTWTMYADGRAYKDGVFGRLGAMSGEVEAQFAQQHTSPAELSVPEEFGRVDRDSPGDKLNDGYNEQCGAYELIAKGARFEVTIKPKTKTLMRPVLEIAGLPAGKALVTAEGQLIEKTTRLGNGNLLVEVPLTIERGVTVNVSVK